MTWGTSFDPFAGGIASEGRLERIELIGLHLRLLGTVALGRFHRLSDFVNASHGYVRVRDAELLDASGKPTDVRLPELMVDQDEIAFMVQVEAAEANTANADQPGAPPAEARDVGGGATDVSDTGAGTDSAPGRKRRFRGKSPSLMSG